MKKILLILPVIGLMFACERRVDEPGIGAPDQPMGAQRTNDIYAPAIPRDEPMTPPPPTTPPPQPPPQTTQPPPGQQEPPPPPPPPPADPLDDN
jgi:outer membrane biosynthesis protein TonB